MFPDVNASMVYWPTRVRHTMQTRSSGLLRGSGHISPPCEGIWHFVSYIAKGFIDTPCYEYFNQRWYRFLAGNAHHVSLCLKYLLHGGLPGSLNMPDLAFYNRCQEHAMLAATNLMQTQPREGEVKIRCDGRCCLVPLAASNGSWDIRESTQDS